MIASDSYTWMNSKQLNAPKATATIGVQGELLTMLDALLVDGFNVQTPSGISVVGDVVTVLYGVPHGYLVKQVISISGSEDTRLNGNHRVTSVTDTSLTIRVRDVTNTSGVLKSRVAPLGWESIFGNTNPLKRAYRSLDPTSTKTVIYLDMTIPLGAGYDTRYPAKRAAVSLCEDMDVLGVQINSYSNAMNDYAKNPEGSLFWHQSQNTSYNMGVYSNSEHSWTMVGNGKYFYLMYEWAWNPTTLGVERGLKDFYAFGDFPTVAGVSDQYPCLWAGNINKNNRQDYKLAYQGGNVGVSATPSGYYMTSPSGVGGLVPFYTSVVGAGYATSGKGNVSFPNPVTGTLFTAATLALSDGMLRSYFPRLKFTPNNLNNDISFDNKLFDDTLLVSMAANTAASLVAAIGYYAFDLKD